MPQETNLNVSPYFDDFDVNKNFYKVLFKPGYPIQARELTTLQSILQNQVEQFGSHIFKEGSSVIDGTLSFDSPFPAIQVESQFNGSPISLYFDLLIGKKIRGAISNVVGEVKYVINNIDSERGYYTLYLNYTQSSGNDFTSQYFADGETLLIEDSLTYGNFTIQSGQGVCNTISTNASTSGSSVEIKDGIYFIRGVFSKVNTQRILLDQYTTNPSYKVGFEIIESVVTADTDESLFDNAQGFSNYAAPGADRFAINLQLSKKLLTDNVSQNFVEIFRVTNGIPQFFADKTQYSLIRDELAKRTADQSGDFYVKPFTLFARDNLNDGFSTPTGVYSEGQITENGNTSSEDLMVYEIGAGKAYVNGYDVETIAPKLLDVSKARTTKTINTEVVQYNAGTLGIVNNAYGAATIGLGTTAVVSLMDSRIGSSRHIAAGTTIGYARVYDFIPESNYVDQTSRLNLRLFDIQTFTRIGLTTSITQTTPALIKGKRSNASGYLQSNVSSSNLLTLYDVSGTFLNNEQIIINGIDDGRLIKSIRDYSISDINSVYSQIGISTFNADLVLNKKSYISTPGTQFNITAASGSPGISTVSSGLGTNFVNKIVSGDIISYSNPSLGANIVYNKVETVSAGGTNFTISAVTDVTGVCVGNLPTSNSTVIDIFKLSSNLNSTDSSLLTPLSKKNIASLDLSNNQLTQRRLFTNQSYSTNSITITVTEPDIYFDSFDEDRFVITYSDGSIEPMSFDKYSLDSTGKQLTFNGLSKNGSGTADIIATVKNTKPNSKTKKLNKANTLVVNYSKYSSSGIGTTTLNDGLTYSQIYGIRVQDQEICLNIPDVIRILGVFESSNTSDPSLPQLKLSSFTGPTNNNQDFIIGEQISGKNSGAIAIIINKVNTDTIEYVYINGSQFENNEIISGKESTTTALITSRILGSKNIIQNFGFDDGQRESFYDYSRLIRNKNTEEPKGKLKIVFQNYTIDSSDTGEFITANSYSNGSYKLDIPSWRNARLTDYIDIRPRVAPYTANSKSPFEFNSRNFANDGQYSKYILAPEENIITSYSYYLPRIDVVYLNKDGNFEISEGIPNDNPSLPKLKSNSLDIAKIYIPAYVFDTADVLVSMSKHKRYRMADISLLEDRIQRVEEFTTLSSLESKTENFIIKDADTGLDRFKCGFFVDNFSTNNYQDISNPNFRCAIDKSTPIPSLRPLHYTTSLDLQLGSEIISGIGEVYNPNADQIYVNDLGSPGVKKTGDLITLNYNERIYNEQLSSTRSENITAFLVGYWKGSIELNPSIDNWFDEKAITTNSFNEVKINVTRPDITNVINKYVATQQPVAYSKPPNSNGGSSPMVYQGFAGGISQNVGDSQSNQYVGGSVAAIGQGGLERALASGYSLSSIQDWINRSGAVVGSVIRDKYGLTSKT